MDQQKSDDDGDNHNPKQGKGFRSVHQRLHASRTTANNKGCADLVHSGFRPAQSFQSERAAKHKRRRYTEESSADEYDEDDDSSDVERRRPHRSNTSSYKITDNDEDLDQDTKPRAIDRNQSAKSDHFSPAVVLHRQQQSNSTTEKKLKSTSKTKKEKSPSREQEPLQLFHRLFEPADGRKKRKRVIVDTNGKNAKLTPIKRRNQKGPTMSTKINVSNENFKGDEQNITTITFEKPVVIDLPPHAIVRGSVTHKILQKLNRLDATLVFDDPFQSGCNNTEVGNSKNEKDLLEGGTVSISEAIQEQTALKENGETAINVVKNGDNVENSALDLVNATKSICIRSTIVPQMIHNSVTQKMYVVILYGKQRGRTGYVIDEIDGRYFLIQSDDPEDVKNGVSWTVNNMHVSTVAEFMAEQQQVRQQQQQRLQTPALPVGFRPENESRKVTSSMKQSKDVKLFLSCLETELATNDSSDNLPKI